MISEASFAKRFTSFWNELLPNAKNYVRLANSVARISTHKPLPTPKRKQNTAFVNILAFNLYHQITNAEQNSIVTFDPGFRNSDELMAATIKSNQYLQRFHEHAQHELPLSNFEWQQTVDIARLLVDRYGYDQDPEIAPSFDGCGFINRAEGDIFIKDTLIEIKSGERSFSLVDFRQVLIYCTLNHFSKRRMDIRSVELFNPRMGILFSDSVDDFARGISSLGAPELFAELESYISSTNFTEISSED